MAREPRGLLIDLLRNGCLIAAQVNALAEIVLSQPVVFDAKPRSTPWLVACSLRRRQVRPLPPEGALMPVACHEAMAIAISHTVVVVLLCCGRLAAVEGPHLALPQLPLWLERRPHA